MKSGIGNLSLALSLVLALAGCAKPAYRYEYKTFDKSEDTRLQTTAGRNQVLQEMQAQGWELVDPEQARPVFTHMTFRRKVRE